MERVSGLSDKPRVLVVNKLYPPWIGGVEKIASGLAEALGDEFRITVLACRSKGPTTVDPVPSPLVVRAGSLGMAASMPLSPGFLGCYRYLSRRCDLVHFHEPFPLGTLCGLVHGFPRAVVTYHADVHRQRVLNLLYAPLQRRFLGRVDRVMATSPDLARGSCQLRGLGERLMVAPLGLADPLAAGPRPGRARIEEVKGPAGGRPMVLAVGRLIGYKGFDVLIRALARTHLPVLYIAGEGPLRPRLEGLARALGLDGRVFFLGRVSEGTLWTLYQAADIFALPSVSPNEAFGLTQLEAMAHALPVINTSLPGVSWVGRDGEGGLTVTPGSVEELARALSELAQSPDRRREMGRSGRARFLREFTLDRLVEQVRSLYRALLAEEPGRRPKRQSGRGT